MDFSVYLRLIFNFVEVAMLDRACKQSLFLLNRNFGIFALSTKLEIKSKQILISCVA